MVSARRAWLADRPPCVFAFESIKTYSSFASPTVIRKRGGNQNGVIIKRQEKIIGPVTTHIDKRTQRYTPSSAPPSDLKINLLKIALSNNSILFYYNFGQL